MRFLAIFYLAIMLAACGSPATNKPDGRVAIACSEIRADSSPSICNPSASLGIKFIREAVASPDVQGGDIPKGAMMMATQRVTNTLPNDFIGIIKSEVDFDCGNGEPTHVIGYGPITVHAGKAILNENGFTCSPAKVGPHILTSTIYAADGTTIVDQQIFRFALIP